MSNLLWLHSNLIEALTVLVRDMVLHDVLRGSLRWEHCWTLLEDVLYKVILLDWC